MDKSPVEQPQQASVQPQTASQSYSEMMNWNLQNSDKVMAMNRDIMPQQAALESQIKAQTADAAAQSYLDTFNKYGSDIAKANRQMTMDSDPLGEQRYGYIDRYLAQGDQPNQQLVDRYDQMFQDAGQDNTLAQAIKQRAEGDLALGGTLDEGTMNEVVNASRRADSARGLALGPQSALAEAMNVGSVAENRRQQRYGNAITALGALGSEDMNQYNKKSTALRAMGTERQQGFANINALLGMTAPARLGETSAAFGASYQPASTTSAASLANIGQWSQINSQAANTAAQNYSTQMGAFTATYESPFQKAMAITDAASGAAMMGIMCWIAREVYGVEDSRWLMFRKWLYSRSPLWFFKWYFNNGPRVAEWLKDKPIIKSIIRVWMDSRIKTLKQK